MPRPVPHQILQVFSNRTAMAQVMMLSEQCVKQAACGGVCRLVQLLQRQREQVASEPVMGAAGSARTGGDACFGRIRLGGTQRQAGSVIQSRRASLSRKVRAAMSLSWPAGLRQFHASAKWRLSRHRLQSGCSARSARTQASSGGPIWRP